MFYVNYYLAIIDDEETTNDKDEKSWKNRKHLRKKNLGVVEEAVGKYNDFDISGDTTGQYLLCNTKLTSSTHSDIQLCFVQCTARSKLHINWRLKNQTKINNTCNVDCKIAFINGVSSIVKENTHY